MPVEKKSNIQRFFDKIVYNLETDCWEWTSVKDRNGYGLFWLYDGMHSAHKVAYIYFNGEIEKGLELDHLCCDRGCVNPLHLEAVTKIKNLSRRKNVSNGNKIKTHCKYGHEFSKENTYSPPGTIYRQCRICLGDRQRERRRGEKRK